MVQKDKRQPTLKAELLPSPPETTRVAPVTDAKMIKNRKGSFIYSNLFDGHSPRLECNL